MSEKRLMGRIVNKHDVEANWLKATNFIPMQGETIIYDIDDNHDYERIKIGDGVKNVSALPFQQKGSVVVSDTPPEDTKQLWVDTTDSSTTSSSSSSNAGANKYGKAIFFGDSLSVGSNNNDYSFVDVLAESGLFESVQKCAYGGATIGPYSPYGDDVNDHCLVNQITRYSEDIKRADIIFLEYGANDRNAIVENGVWLGYASDSENETTMCGYTRKALKAIRSLNKKARLIWLSNDRWHGEYVSNKVFTDEDFLICLEASIYRILPEYNCGSIDITEGFDYFQYVTNDDIHPTTEGHKMIAQNVIANMFKNVKRTHPVRKVTFTSSSDGTKVTSDVEPWLLIEMVKLDIDLIGYWYIPEANATMCLRPVSVNNTEVLFHCMGWDGSTPVAMYVDCKDTGITSMMKWL